MSVKTFTRDFRNTVSVCLDLSGWLAVKHLEDKSVSDRPTGTVSLSCALAASYSQRQHFYREQPVIQLQAQERVTSLAIDLQV